MNWDYIGGFFDGEGTLSRQLKGSRLIFRVTISQTNFEVLSKIVKFTEIGFIIKVTKRKSHWKDAWVYYIARQEDVLLFLKKIRSRVVVKKIVVEKAIPELQLLIKNKVKRRNRLMNRISKTRMLRERGWTYRDIGKLLQVDWGYVRRLDKGMVGKSVL